MWQKEAVMVFLPQLYTLPFQANMIVHIVYFKSLAPLLSTRKLSHGVDTAGAITRDARGN